jgi:hypothetical protein
LHILLLAEKVEAGLKTVRALGPRLEAGRQQESKGSHDSDFILDYGLHKAFSQN